MEIIFILTYNCNFRCKYCDINKRDQDMSKEIISQSLKFLEKTSFDIKKVKFFWGEPLIKKENIKNIILNFPLNSAPNYYVTTNATLVDQDFFTFSRENNLSVTFSLDGDLETTLQNRVSLDDRNEKISQVIGNVKKYSPFIKVNQVITSQNAQNFFDNFFYLYQLWVRNFNFLPEYYALWTKTWLIQLQSWFQRVLDFYCTENVFSVVNIENYSETSFFNLGIVIDTDGSLYGTNLILSGRFEKYKQELKIWDIFSWLHYDITIPKYRKDYINKITSLVHWEYELDVLKSVKYIDLILNNFCHSFSSYK